MEMFDIIEKYCDLCIKRDNFKKNDNDADEFQEEIRNLHKEFMDQINLLDKTSLQNVVNSLISKIGEANLEIKELNKKREEAVLDAKELRIKQEFEGLAPQTNLSDTYYLKIKNVEAKRKCYQYFIDNIDFYSNKKLEFEDEAISNQRS